MIAETTATDEQKEKAAPADSLPFEGGGFLPTCEAALNHRVIDVVVLGCCDFLSFLGGTGFDFFSVAFAVESDYFYREVFELAVGVESCRICSLRGS